MTNFNGLVVSYDPDGNMTNGPLTSSSLVSYSYDARNRPINVGGLNYAYDPAGNRTAITNGSTVTRFVVNPNAKLPQVLMRITGGTTNYYVYGAGLLYQVTETATTSTLLTYHFDLRGSTIALANSGGYVTDQIQYSPYGLVIARTGTNDTPFLYNGRYGVMTDVNGLLYMRARYYNPYICRFINSDPSGFGGGLNWYCFADGNPVSMMDPFGLCGLGMTGISWLDRSMDIASSAVDWTVDKLGSGLQAAGNWVINNVPTRPNFSGGGGNETTVAAIPMLLMLATDGESGLLREAAAQTTAARSATVGLTTYDVSFGSTGNALLDSVGIQDAAISNIRITLDPSLTGADLANVTAHEGFHATIAQTFPNFAASSGRLPYIGAFPLYAEEVGAYGYGALSAGQYGQALLAPINAFGSMTAGQTISVLGTGAAAGGLWYYGHH